MITAFSITKRCRLSWLTNSALVYEPKCGGEGVSTKEYSCAHGAQINHGNITPYLFNLWSGFTLNLKCSGVDPIQKQIRIQLRLQILLFYFKMISLIINFFYLLTWHSDLKSRILTCTVLDHSGFTTLFNCYPSGSIHCP
jgi:hypothetical protein